MNSILHILYQTPGFIKFILDNKYQKKKDTVNNCYELFTITKNNNGSMIEPLLFRKQLGCINKLWMENNQQDSSEFLNFIINEIIKNVGKKVYLPHYDKYNDDIPIIKMLYDLICESKILHFKQTEFSELSNMFNSYNKKIIRCGLCRTKSFVIDPFIILSLGIPDDTENITLENCLDEYYKSEEIEYNCSFCGLSKKSNSRTLIFETSDVLIFLLKRFNKEQKIKKNIKYPEEIDITKYITNTNNNNNNNNIYKLFAVNIHNGTDMNYGHYTSYIKNLDNNKWYNYNDEHVSSINDFYSQDAYILFYNRTK